MVVKLIQSDNIVDLEKQINEFEEKLFNEYKLRIPSSVQPMRHHWSLNSFRYDIKVVPGYYKGGYYNGPEFIAMIQY